MVKQFKIISKHKPGGDQPAAIEKLARGFEKGYRYQTLLGVTGSGKTFTMANVIERVQKPTLVIAHNKTLAAQLTNEFRELFPGNSVNYFVSYYDYYQPEAYMPSSDTYIEKEAMVNDEIDKLRHAATTALLTRNDVIVVASVSCIYGLGAPEVYARNIFHFRPGDRLERAQFIKKLVELQFNRTTADLARGTFRVRGDNWEIMPPDREVIYSFAVREGKIGKIYEINPVEGFRPGVTPELDEIYIAPAKHFITPPEDRARALKEIEREMRARLKIMEKEGKLLEAERLERRTKADMAMMREVGYCHGIENYSRILSGRGAGDPPETLLDYFTARQNAKGDSGGPATTRSFGRADFLTIIDESHVTVPQIQGMYEGDASRKKTLIEYGFRLPSAADNRPLRFHEFTEKTGATIFTSATPAEFEKKVSSQIVEQIIRPTGLVDPKVTLRPVSGQIDDLIPRIEERVKKGDRVLVTTLTKRMAEDLTVFLQENSHGEPRRTIPSTPRPVRHTQGRPEVLEGRQARGEGKQPIKVTYLHSDVDTLDRIKILTNLRKGAKKGGIDVLVGVNLLREGLDLPEVSLVAILDADKEGFLRSETSLVQTIGRAARNAEGEVVMYADKITGSIKRAVGETERRREIQLKYNKEHGITPRTIIREIKDILPTEEILSLETKPLPKSKKSLETLVKEKQKEMKEAAEKLDFELAAILRDEVIALNKKIKRK